MMLLTCYMGRAHPSFHQSVTLPGFRTYSILAQTSHQNNFKFSIAIHYRNRLVWLTHGHAPLNFRFFVGNVWLSNSVGWSIRPSTFRYMCKVSRHNVPFTHLLSSVWSIGRAYWCTESNVWFQWYWHRGQGLTVNIGIPSNQCPSYIMHSVFQVSLCTRKYI